MIHTSKQLKDKVRNISHGDNEIAQTMIRCFIMLFGKNIPVWL